MLWGYFDESGKHDKKTGKLTSLVLGGCVAPVESWQRFTQEWQDVLNEYGVSFFHGVEFESRKTPRGNAYRGWDDDRRRAYLDRLTDVMVGRLGSLIGAKQAATEPEATYIAGVTSAIKNAAQFAKEERDYIKLVFAHNPLVTSERIGRYVDQIRIALPQLQSGFGGDPKTCLPLQAADLVAYEISHSNGFMDFGRYALRKFRSRHLGYHVYPSDADG